MPMAMGSMLAEAKSQMEIVTHPVRFRLEKEGDCRSSPTSYAWTFEDLQHKHQLQFICDFVEYMLVSKLCLWLLRDNLRSIGREWRTRPCGRNFRPPYMQLIR
ncbi:hypothetical protein Ancab_007118 [Ancistrocladus abbreviatus]